MNDKDLAAYQAQMSERLNAELDLAAQKAEQRSGASSVSSIECDIIRQIAVARLNAKLTQEQLAHKVGCSQAYIAKIESHKGSINLVTLIKLCLALNIKIKLL